MKLNWRKIVVNNKTYKYRIGRQNVVIVENGTTEKNKMVVDFSTLKTMSWDTVERAIHKRYFSISPKDIANYITGNEK